jgi:hypothetical protein
VQHWGQRLNRGLPDPIGRKINALSSARRVRALLFLAIPQGWSPSGK